MIHVLLTPPGAPTDVDNLGVVQMDGLTVLIEGVFAAMTADGWLVTIEPDAREAAADWPPVARGRGYLDAFLVEHPELLSPDPSCCGACGLIVYPLDPPAGMTGVEPDTAAARLGHRTRVDPPAGMTGVERWTCLDCGAAVLRYGVHVYGSALENRCPSEAGP